VDRCNWIPSTNRRSKSSHGQIRYNIPARRHGDAMDNGKVKVKLHTPNAQSPRPSRRIIKTTWCRGGWICGDRHAHLCCASANIIFSRCRHFVCEQRANKIAL